MKKIDIYNHVLPPAYFELVKTHSKDAGFVKRVTSIPMLWDVEARAAMLAQQFPDVVQVLTLSAPSPEMLGPPEQSPEFQRIAPNEYVRVGGTAQVVDASGKYVVPSSTRRRAAMPSSTPGRQRNSCSTRMTC